MDNNDNFGFIFDNMTRNYARVETLLENLYQHIQANPSDEAAISFLQELGSVAKEMIHSQIEFTSAYCDKSLRDNLIDKLVDKETALANALEETRGRSR